MDEWQPGDLALCVTDEYERTVKETKDLDWWPKLGGIYEVASVEWSPSNLFLELTDDPDKFNPFFGWYAVHFIKVTPKAADAEDAETIRLLNTVPEVVQ